MKISFKKSFMFMMLLLALTVSALGVTPALADDGVTPPADAPVVEEPVADVPVTDVPVADAPIVDVPAAEESTVAEEPAVALGEETAPVAEVLEQLPEGTDLVVVDPNGDVLPLVSQEAAETLSSPSSDPFFWDGAQYVGYSATGICPAQVATCNTSATPLQAAITAFGASSTATGSIYVAAGTYAADVVINGSLGNNLANLTGLVGEGSATTILNGNVTVQNMQTMNIFTFQGFTLNGSFEAGFNGTAITPLSLNVTDIVQMGDATTVYGVVAHNSIGDVTLTDVDTSGNTNGNGVAISNITGNTTITTNEGTSTIQNNGFGLWIERISGNITINDVTIQNNGTGSINAGYNGSTAIFNCVTFSGNTSGGMTTHPAALGWAISTNTQTSTGCGSGGTGGGSSYVTVPSVPVIPPVTPVIEGLNSTDGNEPVQYASLYTVLELTQDQLPAELEAGTFGSALKVSLTDQGENTANLVITLSFPIPDGMKDASLVVMFWNGSAWVEVSGGSVVNGLFVITVNQPGDYVLVAK